jgi:TolB-like protein
MSADQQRGGFFAELKRRNVFRVAVAYLVAAWLLLQVTDIVLDNINAPDWIIQVFMLALVVGLPVALIFAWAFEMTPEGLKREKDVDRSRSITHHTGRKLDRVIIGILALAVVVLVVDRVRHAQQDEIPGSAETAAADSAEAAPSIAVLPFVNMSSDPEQEYFSDGISEEILNSLAKVKELRVAGRTSSFAFKGQNQDLRQIGDTLGVEHILEGSVRKSGATVRITAQLIQVDDGFHLWSETYDRELTDIFAIQDEISSAILEQLKAHLVGLAETPAPAAADRTDSAVYDLYLLARQRIYERKGPSIQAAAELLDRAIARDPQYAPAYAQRGITELLLSEDTYGTLPRAQAWAQAKLYLDKALQLDPEVAEAWAGLGLYHINRPGENSQAIENLEKALAINPNLIDASNWLQNAYGNVGDRRRALQILEQMVDRDPFYPPGFGNLILAYNDFGMQDRRKHVSGCPWADRRRPWRCWNRRIRRNPTTS